MENRTSTLSTTPHIELLFDQEKAFPFEIKKLYKIVDTKCQWYG